MTRTLGLIGSGMIGGSLARLAVAAGLDVVLSNSRGPETLGELVAELGPRARAASPAEAAHAGDIVVTTIPLYAHTSLPAEALAGKTVIDTMNYNPDRDGRIAELEDNAVTSSELVHQHLSHSHMVKACNNILFTHLRDLARPVGAADRSALPIAGDEAEPKAEVTRLLDTLGYDTVDVGPLADSWRMGPNTPTFVKPYLPPIPAGMSREEMRHWLFQAPGLSLPAARLKDLVQSAVRGPAGDSPEFFGGK